MLALLTAMPFLDVGVGEFWGIWRDAIPRVTFQTALPYLLALVVGWRDRPRRWPWLMIIAGLMVFFHSISAPAWGLAIWLGLWLYHPASWKWPRRLGVMAGLGLLFLAALSPFVLIFLSYQSSGATTDYDLVMTIINTFQPKNILNVGAALADFLWAATRSLLLPLALIGAAATWRIYRSDRKPVKMVLLWLAGIFITAILVPAAERVVEGYFRIPPIDTELVRGMRYLVPLMLIFWLWPLAALEPRFTRPARRPIGDAGRHPAAGLLDGDPYPRGPQDAGSDRLPGSRPPGVRRNPRLSRHGHGAAHPNPARRADL